MNPTAPLSNSQSRILDSKDLQPEHLGDYLTLSVRSDGNDTTVSIATTDNPPQIFTAVLQGIVASNFQMLLYDAALNSLHDPIL
ncbi:hypothetical protein [Methylomicrobium lacus]|uniref:hypothetical protein n=1 Tax=Methylomicrobium lacus TaxID=136992 RepID=UPI0035A920FE